MIANNKSRQNVDDLPQNDLQNQSTPLKMENKITTKNILHMGSNLEDAGEQQKVWLLGIANQLSLHSERILATVTDDEGRILLNGFNAVVNLLQSQSEEIDRIYQTTVEWIRGKTVDLCHKKMTRKLAKSPSSYSFELLPEWMLNLVFEGGDSIQLRNQEIEILLGDGKRKYFDDGNPYSAYAEIVEPFILFIHKKNRKVKKRKSDDNCGTDEFENELASSTESYDRYCKVKFYTQNFNHLHVRQPPFDDFKINEKMYTVPKFLQKFKKFV
eukprot:TRINITY_DN8276_c0_g1_i1.p1 TRINITY_DN8276_c0_g1~~TRINITY_DN8276_c0_g1_i1.p1  ORF type:complete len:271 (+),score=36.38 TRINITY_DN8276_c0_g1_i1:89-901(+)